MCSPSPPSAPDLLGAARQQGAENRQTAITQGKINNPNVVNPYGSQMVTYGGAFDQAGFDTATQNYNQQLREFEAANKYRNDNNLYKTPVPMAPLAPDRAFYEGGDKSQATLTQSFAPAQQALFDESNKAKLSLSQLATRGAGAAGDVLGKNVDFSGMPGAPTSGGVNQRVIDAMMGRVNEDYGKATDEKNSALIAAGIRPGSTAYDNSMQLLNRGKNDASQQAVLAGYQQGGVEYEKDAASRRNAIAEYMAQRQAPLNEINSLQSGSQVANAFAMPSYAQNAQVAPSPLYGAAQGAGNWQSDLYNAQAAGAGNQQAGLIGLGGTAIMGGALML